MLAEKMLEMSQLLNDLAISNCTIGGMAVNAHGYIRGTDGVDFLVYFDEEEKRNRLLTAIQEKGWPWKYHKTGRVDRIGNITRVKTPLQIDLIEPKNEYEFRFFPRALHQSLKGVPLNVISPEDLIILKLRAFGPQDKIDLHRILENNMSTMDTAYLEATIEEAHLTKNWQAAKLMTL